MNEREHWLPPDNVQEHSRESVAARTSPTNIGMGLLSGLAAYDLGYLTGTGLIERTRRTLHTIQRLQRCRGHLFNWYDTRTLQPVEPRYVSSVDSGNLWGALAVLAVGLDELCDRPAVPPRFLEGLQDTLAVIAALRSAALFTAFDDPFDACLGQLCRQCAGPSPRSARCCVRGTLRNPRTGGHAGRRRPRRLSRFAAMDRGVLATVVRGSRGAIAMGILASHAATDSPA